MIEVIRALLSVQEVDAELGAVRSEAAELPRRRAASAAEQQRQLEAVEAANETLSDQEHTHRQLEASLGDVEALLAKLEGQTYEVTSNQAFEALQHEIARARGQRSDLEDQILECLEMIDASKATRDAARDQQRESADAAAVESEEMLRREKEIADEVERLEIARKAYADGVESEALRLYETVARRHSPAVVLLVGKSCPACRMAIPPQMRLEIRRGTLLVQCRDCTRILYADPATPSGDSQAA